MKKYSSQTPDQTLSPMQLAFLYEDFGDELRATIRQKVARLIGRFGFTPADFDDLVQEVTSDLLRRLESYDPSRGSVATFSSRVIDHRIAYLIKRRRTRTRIHPEGPLSLGELPEEQCDEHLATQHLACLAAEDLRIDLERTLSVLPEALGSICRLLREVVRMGESPAAYLPRKVFQRAIERLGHEFRQAGLHEYL